MQGPQLQWEASGWASHAEGGNFSQAPRENSRRMMSGGRGFVICVERAGGDF